MTPGLYVVGTPIGNLDDLSPRAIQTLSAAEAILSEDTRHTRVLLDRFGIRTPLVSCHKFNEASRIERAVERIRAGAALALVTDSGMPAVSDPGSRLVAACRRAGLAVTCVPGPSAVTTAVALSGFGGNGFVFAGFAPRKSGAMRRLLGELAGCPVPVVLFESPFRVLKLLGEVAALLGDRPVFMARELTKKFEETRTGSATELAAAYAGRTIKGEIVIVIAPRVDREEPGC